MMRAITSGPGGQVKSAARALDVLELLASHPSGLSLAQIAAELASPRSSAHALLTTLVRRGALRTRGTSPGVLYTLGIRVFEIGQAYLHTVDLVRDAQVALERLSHECGETVHLAVLDGAEIVYLVKHEGVQAVRMVSAVGRRHPAYGTAVGKVLLAGCPDPHLDALIPPRTALPALTPKTITDPDRLRTELATVRRRGFAVENGQSTVGLGCVAVPVYDSRGLVAGLSVSVPTPRFSRGHREQLLEQARECATALSRQLGAGDRPVAIRPGDTRLLEGLR